MSNILVPWICDGLAKHDPESFASLGQHEPFENFTDKCLLCFLPMEAIKSEAQLGVGEKLQGDKGAKDVKIKFLILGTVMGVILSALGIAIVSFLIDGDGFFLERDFIGVRRDNNLFEGLISRNARLPEFISQGEKIFFVVDDEIKTKAASAFSVGDWEVAIALYQQYIDKNPEDQEGRIYLQNAIAQKKTNPITIGVAVMANWENQSSQEILKGVADVQEEFNGGGNGDRLLQVVIIDYQHSEDNQNLAQDIINADEIIGVVGYGLDSNTKDTLTIYQSQELGVIFPLNSYITNDNLLKTIALPEGKKTSEYYLKSSTKRLLSYANNLNSPPALILFYDSSSDSSMALRGSIKETLPEFRGKVTKEVDVHFNPQPEKILNESHDGNTIMVALGQEKLDQALKIFEVNNYFLTTLASDEFVNINTLTQGGSTVDQVVMTLPLGYDFDVLSHISSKSIDLVFWDSFTVYHLTKNLVRMIALNPHRSTLNNTLKEGINLSEENQNISLQIPLLQIVPNFESNNGLEYQFEINNTEN